MSSVAALYPPLRSLIGLYARADLAAQQHLQALRSGIEGLLCTALSPDEKIDLTIHLYGLQPVERETKLSDWEAVWFMQTLPRPPARVLLAAAGGGRELAWLSDAGYHVDAFEPAARHAAALQERADARTRTLRGSFDDLIGAVLRSEPTPLRAFAEQRYAALILGWGSLTHVLEPHDRVELLRACDQLAGDGPVLASFWLRATQTAHDRARQLGESLGTRVAKLRGRAGANHEGLMFRPYCGFAHEFTRDEIESLGAECGRQVNWGDNAYPHVTFTKRVAQHR